MKPWMFVLLTIIGAGLVQFSILVGSGITTPLQLCAGVAGAIGTAIAGLFARMPQKEWTDEQRAAKLGDK